MESAASLQGCVSGLSSSLSMLRSASQMLNEGIKDFPRLSTVLETNRVFDIVAEQEVLDAKTELAQEVEPQVASLLSRIEVELARLERKEKGLSSKAKLQEVRIQQLEALINSEASGYRRGVNSDRATEEQLEELRELQAQSDRLAYSLSRANLKQRKMRMSMAMTGGR